MISMSLNSDFYALSNERLLVGIFQVVTKLERKLLKPPPQWCRSSINIGGACYFDAEDVGTFLAEARRHLVTRNVMILKHYTIQYCVVFFLQKLSVVHLVLCAPPILILMVHLQNQDQRPYLPLRH